MIEQHIIQEVCDYFHVPVDYIQEKGRNKTRITVKHLAIYYVNKFTNKSQQEIGELFNCLDHASVYHALRSVSAQCDTDKIYKSNFDEINVRIKEMIEDKKHTDHLIEQEIYLENDFYKN